MSSITFPDDDTASLGLDGSERPVWLFDDAEYRLGPPPPDRTATITGVAAAGRTLPYYPPPLFVGREAPGEGWETVAAGRMALTSHGLRLYGSTADVTLSYGAVRRWEPCRDGIGAVVSRPAQPEQLAVFQNGDGWFAYNLVRKPGGHPACRYPRSPAGHPHSPRRPGELIGQQTHQDSNQQPDNRVHRSVPCGRQAVRPPHRPLR